MRNAFSSQAAHLGALTVEVGRLRLSLKRSFFAKRLDEAGKNSKAAWRVLHDFIGKTGRTKDPLSRTFSTSNGMVTDDHGISEAFCEFYTGIGPQLAGKIKQPASGSFLNYLGPRSVSSAFFAPTSPGEIESLCRGLDCSKSPGHDEFSPAVLSYIAAEISGLLSAFINKCLET